MRLVIANIKNNPDMADRLVRADVSEIRKLNPHSVLWQEIGEREDHDAVESEMGRRYRHLHTELPIPISLRKSPLQVIEAGRKKLHDGKADASPARFVDWAIVEHRERPALDPFIIANLHLVSGAWNDKPKPHKEWRQERWLESWELLQGITLEWYNDGFTSIFGGDWNRVNIEKFHRKQRWLIAGGIDKVGCLESPRSNVRIAVQDQDHIDLHSDHHAKVLDFTLRRAA